MSYVRNETGVWSMDFEFNKHFINSFINQSAPCLKNHPHEKKAHCLTTLCIEEEKIFIMKLCLMLKLSQIPINGYTNHINIFFSSFYDWGGESFIEFTEFTSLVQLIP